MRYMSVFVLVFMVTYMLLTSCESDSTEPENKTGTLKIWLTDSYAEYDSVNIHFSEFSAHVDSEWVVVNSDPLEVNLLDWTNGNAMLVSSAEVPAGHYTQIRLIIESADVVVDGQHYSLTVPSGAQSGLKFGPEFDIAEGSSYELVLDFDANRSVVTTGSSQNPTGYILKPYIRVISKAVTGSISGMVTNPEHLPLAKAIQGNDTVSTPVDTLDGSFKLSFLPEGVYSVSIEDTLDQQFVQGNVTVTPGSDSGIGNVTLN